MLVNQALSESTIIDCIYRHYGIKIISLSFLPLGADINATIYKAQAQNKSNFFVKIKRGHHPDIAITTMQLLHKAGIQQVIFPVKTIEGQPIQPLHNFTLILYPFIEGQDGFTSALTNEQWLKLGKTLRQVHEINVPPPIQEQIRRETFSSKWRDIVRSLYPRIEAKPIGDKVALNLLDFMRKNIKIIQRLVDRAEQLAQNLQNQSLQFVFCHSDIHGGNVLISNDDTIYIVDWDAPIMAPKERDLMFIGGGVANVWNKPQEEAVFYKGYGQIEINRTILAYYRHERIVEDIAEYGQELLLKTVNSENRLEMYQHFVAMFEPNGVIDIAFHTDENFSSI